MQQTVNLTGFPVRWFESSPVHHPPIRGHPLKSLEIAENLAYYRQIRPPASGVVRVQPEQSVGGMWGKIILPPHFASPKCGGRMWGKRDGQAHSDCGQGSFGESWHRSEEHTSELQSLMRISYAVFCLKKTKN